MSMTKPLEFSLASTKVEIFEVDDPAYGVCRYMRVRVTDTWSADIPVPSQLYQALQQSLAGGLLK